MFTKKQNAILNQTGPGTPLGEVMRRYWVPALMSEEVPEPDCPPVRVHILSEDLVAFRDSNGRIGLLAEHCAHRGTSLFFARNELCGLRCGYHGWKYDVDGNVLDTPAEPPNSRFKAKVKQPAYPTHEVAGIVFAYLGPRDEMPAFPNYEWTNLPLDRTYVAKSYLDCSWLQGLEGESDSAHLNFLHRIFDDSGYEDIYYGKMPKYETEETDFGLRMVALRDAGDQTYCRVSSFVMPFSVWIPARTREVHMYVPMTDGSSWRWDFGMSPTPIPPSEPVPRRDQLGPGFMRHANALQRLLHRPRGATDEDVPRSGHELPEPRRHGNGVDGQGIRPHDRAPWRERQGRHRAAQPPAEGGRVVPEGRAAAAPDAGPGGADGPHRHLRTALPQGLQLARRVSAPDDLVEEPIG